MVTFQIRVRVSILAVLRCRSLQHLAQALVLMALNWPSVISHADTLAAASRRPPRVLVLFSDDRLLPANVAGDEAIRATFSAATHGTVEFYSEFLDVDRFPGEAQQDRERDFIRERYRERPPDLVIAGGGPALAFLVKYRATLFTQVPIVHCAVSPAEIPKTLPDDRIVGIPLAAGPAPTMELALRIQPDTRAVVIVGSSSIADRQRAMAPGGEFSQLKKRVNISWLTNQSLTELRQELARLPDHTVVLYRAMVRDSAGNTFTPRDALDKLAPASRVPIYGYYDTYLGHGIVGGSMVTFETIGRRAAQIGLRILAGADPQTAARSDVQHTVPMFDWRQLHRWNINEELLPPDSIVRDREPTTWEQHRVVILLAAGLCGLEAFLIAFLLLQRRRRRRAEASLRDSEQRMTLAVEAANFGIWIRDLARNEIWASDRWRDLFGFAKEERLELAGILEKVHPEDRESLGRKFASVVEHEGDYETQYRIVLPGDQVRWISSHGRVERNGSGKPVIVRGVSRDITGRKLAESEIQLQRAELVHVTRVSTMGQLASSLAHELNQPLGAILHNAEAAEILLQNGPPDIEEIRAILADIRQDDQRAGAIIDRMRTLVRHRQFQGSPLNMNTLTGEVVTLVRPDAERRNTKVTWKPAPTAAPVFGDHVELQQVILNLLLNAMDAMNDCPAEARRAYVRVSLVAAQVEVAVSDAGHGISEENLTRLFAPFFTTKPTGLGMGLAISQTIIVAHKGRLTAENNANGGATFRVTLPMAERKGNAA